jgi:exodeoxyribonuclease VII large subunit
MTRPLLLSLFDETERRPLTVSELTGQVRAHVENRFKTVWVEGEISNFRIAQSGHWYFTIKDATAQLRATCFRPVNNRIRFRPSDGLQVRARGRLTVYEPRGEYELSVEALDPVGAGALKVAFEQLRESLAAEGLFDEALKRPLPLLPRRVGLVTSASGAALHDILNVIARRTRTVHVLLAPVRVQGEGAGREIASAIKLLNEHNSHARERGREGETIDALIVGRGGGSSEDLWAFNEEEVARAVRASKIPVISAVGHETDFTITDFAADVRAPTPSAAAEMVAAREDELVAALTGLVRDLARAAHFNLMNNQTRLQEAVMSPVFDNARARLRSYSETVRDSVRRLETLMLRRAEAERRRLTQMSCCLSPARPAAHAAGSRTRLRVAENKLVSVVNANLENKRRHIAVASAALDALSPLAVLGRGYALATRAETGEIVRSYKTITPGERLNLRLAEGAVRCHIEEVEKA